MKHKITETLEADVKDTYIVLRKFNRKGRSAGPGFTIFPEEYEGLVAILTDQSTRRVSISLSAEDAAFLHALLRATGDGGPLWEAIGDESADNPYTASQRRAFWRLVDMVERVTKQQ